MLLEDFIRFLSFNGWHDSSTLWDLPSAPVLKVNLGISFTTWCGFQKNIDMVIILSWWLFSQPIWKNMNVKMGKSIFPNFRDDSHTKIFELATNPGYHLQFIPTSRGQKSSKNLNSNKDRKKKHQNIGLTLRILTPSYHHPTPPNQTKVVTPPKTAGPQETQVATWAPPVNIKDS